MKILFLDDERFPENVTWIDYPKDAEFVIVRNYNEFLDALRMHPLPFDSWSLDHDLGPDELTGYDTLKAAIRWYESAVPSQVVAHSKNPIGAKNINKYWENYVSNRN